jgi:hypothetical protein
VDAREALASISDRRGERRVHTSQDEELRAFDVPLGQRPSPSDEYADRGESDDEEAQQEDRGRGDDRGHQQAARERKEDLFDPPQRPPASMRFDGQGELDRDGLSISAVREDC